MSSKKKYFITGAIALVTISGAYLYWQYTKLMEYAIKFAGIKVKNASLTNVNLDIYLTFSNKSNLSFSISEQEYKVYLNNIFLTEISKPSTQKIGAKSVSPLTVNVDFNPSKVGQEVKGEAANLLLNIMNASIRVDIKLKIELWNFIKIAVPFTYSTTIGALMSPKK